MIVGLCALGVKVIHSPHTQVKDNYLEKLMDGSLGIEDAVALRDLLRADLEAFGNKLGKPQAIATAFLASVIDVRIFEMKKRTKKRGMNA